MELVVGVPLVRLWSYSETKIPIWEGLISNTCPTLNFFDSTFKNYYY